MNKFKIMITVFVEISMMDVSARKILTPTVMPFAFFTSKCSNYELLVTIQDLSVFVAWNMDETLYRKHHTLVLIGYESQDIRTFTNR